MKDISGNIDAAIGIVWGSNKSIRTIIIQEKLQINKVILKDTKSAKTAKMITREVLTNIVVLNDTSKISLLCL